MSKAEADVQRDSYLLSKYYLHKSILKENRKISQCSVCITAKDKNKIKTMLKTTARYHHTLIRKIKIQNADNTNAGEDASGNVKWYSTFGRQCAASYKTKPTLLYNPTIILLGIK